MPTWPIPIYPLRTYTAQTFEQQISQGLFSPEQNSTTQISVGELRDEQLLLLKQSRRTPVGQHRGGSKRWPKRNLKGRGTVLQRSGHRGSIEGPQAHGTMKGYDDRLPSTPYATRPEADSLFPSLRLLSISPSRVQGVVSFSVLRAHDGRR